MSIAKKCDRCGALYEPYGDNNPIKCNGVCTSYISPAGAIWNHKTIDLCPECMAEFKMLTDEPKAQVFVIDQIIEVVNTCINHDTLTSESIRKELSNQRASWMPDVKGGIQWLPKESKVTHSVTMFSDDHPIEIVNKKED